MATTITTPSSIQGEITPHMIEMLRCRAMQHPWEDRGWLPMIKKTIRGWEQLLQCPRCEAKRFDFRVKGAGGSKSVIRRGKKVRKSNPRMPLFSRYYTYRDDFPGDVSKDEALEIVIMWEDEHPTEAVQLAKLNPKSRIGKPVAEAG